MSIPATIREPETRAQAGQFETVKNHAVSLGNLCYRCACQFAYATQHGFYAVETPCDTCTLTMASWPIPEGNGWRRPGRGSTHHTSTWEAASTRTASGPPTEVPPSAAVRLHDDDTETSE